MKLVFQKKIAMKRKIYLFALLGLFLDDFNIARDYGYARAVIKKFVVTVKDGKGLSVDFHKKEGEPILNAIRIYRNY